MVGWGTGRGRDLVRGGRLPDDELLVKRKVNDDSMWNTSRNQCFYIHRGGDRNLCCLIKRLKHMKGIAFASVFF